jgi:hypothetical protein
MKNAKMLIDILARIDALYWPFRGDLDARRAVYELRQDYRELGLSWRIGGDAAARQAKLRELDAMAGAGRISVVRAPGHKSAFVKLTDAVDTELRRLACLADYQASLHLLGCLKEEIAAGRCFSHCGQTWVRETHLAGIAYGEPDTGRILGAYAEYMLPLLVRGLAESNADIQGRVWYTLTPAGEAIAPSWQEAESLPLRGYDPAARKRYLTATRRERGRLADCTPRNPQDIEPIPLPVSTGL